MMIQWGSNMAVDRVLNSIINSISLEERIDKRVVKEVAFHPLLFFKRKAESGDMRPTRLMYWGAFVPKSGKNTKEGAMKYIAKYLLDNIEEVWESLDYYGFQEFYNSKKLKEAVEDALETRDKKLLDKLYKGYKEHLKNV